MGTVQLMASTNQPMNHLAVFLTPSCQFWHAPEISQWGHFFFFCASQYLWHESRHKILYAENYNPIVGMQDLRDKGIFAFRDLTEQ